MKFEIRYLVAIVLAIYLAVVAHALLASQRTPPLRGAASGERHEFSDAEGAVHAMPANWVGSGRVASLLNADLDSRLRFVSRGEDGRVIQQLGASAVRLNSQGTTDKVQTIWSNGVTRISWSADDNDFAFSHSDGMDTADLYVTRNRVRYLVPMFSEESAGSATRGVASIRSVLLNTVREGIALVMPRFVVLLVLYVIVAGGFYLVVWRLMKDKLRHRKVQDEWPKKGRLMTEFGHSLIVIFAMALFSFGTVLVAESGYAKIYKNVSDHGWGYWLFSLGFIFLLMDAFTYWTHRLMHHPSIFMYTHAIHHRSYHPSPWTTLSMSVNEIIINAVFMPVVVLIMPVHQHIAIAFTLLTLFKNVFNHLGFELFPAWVNKWMVGATYHETHHMRFNGNYSSYFTWWDKWMKTESRAYASNVERIRAGTAA